MHNLTDLIETDQSIPVAGITSDSRQVRKNYVFAALQGTKVKGADYIHDAIHLGARAILAEPGTELPKDSRGAVLVESDNPRKSLAQMAAKFYGQQPKTIVAVTGTNGKTSVANFCQQLWDLSGVEKNASMGTLGVRGKSMVKSGSMTTPDPVSLHATLADMAAVGITHLAIEASSHGLHQYRLDGVKMTAAAFTNLSHDHLDYHGDMDSYFQSKARLFSEVTAKGSKAVINADDERYPELKSICEAAELDVISYGETGEDILLKKHEVKPEGQEIEIIVNGEEYVLTLPLVGDFQVMNALCALGLTGVDPKLLEQLQGVPGRLQLVPGHPKGAVYVDYAHTPDALEHVLAALRTHTQSRLICIIGCGGDRDMKKRAVMGRIAAEKSDMPIIADDNPRSENPEAIRKAMMEFDADYKEIGDRKEAIQWAIKNMEDGDVLVIAGKGHEEGQEIAGTIHPFNDFNEAHLAIEGIN
ncbi:MAG: UDP-N-acetylmuramoyl-L-alanyl-D-glutamate--2,6-diaminopimelate ligase [Pseudomonadota bacterium]